MTKVVYLMLDDEPLDRRSIVIVDSEEKAKILVKQRRYDSYEEISLLSDDDVKENLCDEILSNMENWEAFDDAYCKNCVATYNEVCPFNKEVSK